MDKLQLTPPHFSDEQLAAIAGALVITGTERSGLVRLLQLIRRLREEEAERLDGGASEAYLHSWLFRFVAKLDEDVSLALLRMLQREGLVDDDNALDVSRLLSEEKV